MKVVGIIAEYNPFHNGHLYQIQTIKEKTNADYIIVAMSGNFVQRGTLSIVDKFARTQMALSCGADFVFEIPTIWATASAEYFATAGVRLLAATGVVTHLCFGTEDPDLTSLSKIADILSNETPSYIEALQSFQKQGLSFPAAREKALATVWPDLNTSLLSKPNNILAIEYLRALKGTSIQPLPIQRKGSGYHDTDITNTLASASAIRNAIQEKQETGTLSASMPKEAFSILSEYMSTQRFLDPDAISQILGYRLLMEENYTKYADVSEDLANRIKNALPDYHNFSQFCKSLKTRELTHSRISRGLLHILLSITKEDYELGKELGFVPYLRVLGFKKDAADLFSVIKKEASAPLISKVADASKLLSPEANILFHKDLFATDLYHQLIANVTDKTEKSDYTQPIILL